MNTSNLDIRVGIVGAGANTCLRHIPGLQALPGVRIVGVVNRTEASSRRVAEQFGIPRIYRHWREAVEDPETNAIVIGTWPYLHAPITIAALECGKHVLTEARMAMNAAEARAMWEAARRRPHLVAQIVPSPFSLGVDLTVRRLLAEGQLGTLRYIEHREPRGFLDPDQPLHWRQDIALNGFNIQMLGVVYEMILRWVGEATRVMAMGRVFVPYRRREDGSLGAVRIPDHLDVLAELAGGALLHIQQSTVTAFQEGAGTWLYGDLAVLVFRDGQLWMGRRGDAGLARLEIPPHERGEWRVEADFVAAIRGEQPVRLTTFEDGVRYMEFTEAVWRSMQEGREIRLPLFP